MGPMPLKVCSQNKLRRHQRFKNFLEFSKRVDEIAWFLKGVIHGLGCSSTYNLRGFFMTTIGSKISQLTGVDSDKKCWLFINYPMTCLNYITISPLDPHDILIVAPLDTIKSPLNLHDISTKSASNPHHISTISIPKPHHHHFQAMCPESTKHLRFRGLVWRSWGSCPKATGWIMVSYDDPHDFRQKLGVYWAFSDTLPTFRQVVGKKTSFWTHILRESCEISKRTMQKGCKLHKGRFGAATQVSHTCWALSGLGVFKHEHHLGRKLSQLEIQSCTYPAVDDWILRMCPLQRHATGGDCWCFKEVQ
jgi:hypothetical protein